MVPSSIGDSLGGRYRLTGVLGSGGMATVYRARDELLGRDVAVKLFPPVPLDADELGRHRAEVMVLAMLTHPGLVTLYDAGATPTDAGMHESYLVMELVEGPSLAAHLARGSLGTDQAALLGSQIADALVTVHTAGIVHRDIKPANILLVDGDSLDRIAPGPSTGPAVKLADFGIARVAGAERLTATGTTLGTASYLSPEQAVGGAVDAATDVYALGLVLLESITGAPAFTGTVAEIAVARLHRSPDVPPALGPAWTEVLTAMTEREPDLRPTARDVADALHALVGAGRAEPDGPDGAGSSREASGPARATPSSAPTASTIAAAAPGPPDAPTEGVVTRAMPTPQPDPAADDRPTRGPWRSRRRPVLVSAVVAAAAVTAIVLGASAVRDASTAEPTAPASYPAVDGTLGDALETLQGSVEP